MPKSLTNKSSWPKYMNKQDDDTMHMTVRKTSDQRTRQSKNGLKREWLQLRKNLR